MNKTQKNYYEFFKSTLLINISVTLVSILFGGLDSFFFIFASFGFTISLLYKEIYKKNEYFFYANNGISKIQLIISSYGFTLFFSVLGMFLYFNLKELF